MGENVTLIFEVNNMKKAMIAVVLFVLCASSFAGTVGLPLEKLAMPVVEGDHLVCVWDQAAGGWLSDFTTYDQTGVYDFQLPEWGQWYWVGLWDQTAEEYVYGKWIGHFPMTN